MPVSGGGTWIQQGTYTGHCSRPGPRQCTCARADVFLRQSVDQREAARVRPTLRPCQCPPTANPLKLLTRSHCQHPPTANPLKMVTRSHCQYPPTANALPLSSAVAVTSVPLITLLLYPVISRDTASAVYSVPPLSEPPLRCVQGALHGRRGKGGFHAVPAEWIGECTCQ